MSTYGSDRNVPLNTNRSTFGSSGYDDKKQSYSLHLSTIHLAGLHLLMSMSIFIAGAYLELRWMTEFNCRTYYILIYVRAIYWVITYILDMIVTYRHNDLRRHGYHDFYRKKILSYKNAPFAVVTLWNTIIFIVQTIMIQNYGIEFTAHCQRTIQSPVTYICMFCGLETILLMFIHGTYIMKVWNFNSIHSLPDALRDIDQPFIGSLGITIDNAKVADLLEKQADLIYYLKEQNLNLKRKLLQFNQREKYGSYEKI